MKIYKGRLHFWLILATSVAMLSTGVYSVYAFTEQDIKTTVILTYQDIALKNPNLTQGFADKVREIARLSQVTLPADNTLPNNEQERKNQELVRFEKLFFASEIPLVSPEGEGLFANELSEAAKIAKLSSEKPGNEIQCFEKLLFASEIAVGLPETEALAKSEQRTSYEDTLREEIAKTYAELKKQDYELAREFLKEAQEAVNRNEISLASIESGPLNEDKKSERELKGQGKLFLASENIELIKSEREIQAVFAEERNSVSTNAIIVENTSEPSQPAAQDNDIDGSQFATSKTDPPAIVSDSFVPAAAGFGPEP